MTSLSMCPPQRGFRACNQCGLLDKRQPRGGLHLLVHWGWLHEWTCCVLVQLRADRLPWVSSVCIAQKCATQAVELQVQYCLWLSHDSVDSSETEICMCPDIPNLLRAAGASREQAENVETSSRVVGDIQRAILGWTPDTPETWMKPVNGSGL